MIIAIVGTPSAGKKTVLDYLVQTHGFLQIGLEQPSDPAEGARLVRQTTLKRHAAAELSVRLKGTELMSCQSQAYMIRHRSS